MLGLGIGEILLVAVVVLVVVGPDNLPHLLRNAGRAYAKIRRASDEMRRAFVLEADRQDAEGRYSELRKTREEAKAHHQEVSETLGGAVVPSEVSTPLEEPPAVRPETGVSEAEWEYLPDNVKRILAQEAEKAAEEEPSP